MAYKKKDGTTGYKKCGSMDEVNSFRAEQDGEMVIRAEQDGEMVLWGQLVYKKCGSIDEVNTFRAEQDAKADACM